MWGVWYGLPAAVVRRMEAVVPANMQLDAGWERIRCARAAAKAAGKDLSPSLMLAWCVTRAMDRQAAFRRLVRWSARCSQQHGPHGRHPRAEQALWPLVPPKGGAVPSAIDPNVL